MIENLYQTGVERGAENCTKLCELKLADVAVKGWVAGAW
jgi:hypothetical protein